jgi:hypothetical protein
MVEMDLPCSCDRNPEKRKTIITISIKLRLIYMRDLRVRFCVLLRLQIKKLQENEQIMKIYIFEAL